MKKIRIEGIEGYYYIEDNYLCHSCNDLQDDINVSDLTELRVWEYNELVNKINKNYPKYKMSYLKGSFI